MNDMIFLNLDKINEVCLECKKNQLRSRRVRDKKAILEKLSCSSNVFLISEEHSEITAYKDFSCALAHYDKECMKDCVCSGNKLEKPLENYNFWAYSIYPSS